MPTDSLTGKKSPASCLQQQALSLFKAHTNSSLWSWVRGGWPCASWLPQGDWRLQLLSLSASVHATKADRVPWDLKVNPRSARNEGEEWLPTSGGQAEWHVTISWPPAAVHGGRSELPGVRVANSHCAGWGMYHFMFFNCQYFEKSLTATTEEVPILWSYRIRVHDNNSYSSFMDTFLKLK